MAGKVKAFSRESYISSRKDGRREARCTFHALRHTFATACVEKGFDVKSLSEILGHASVSTTLSIYVHPSLRAKKRQMDLLSPVSRP